MTVAPPPKPDDRVRDGPPRRNAARHAARDADPAVCPSCGGANGCRVEAARAGGHCWCFDARPAAPETTAAMRSPGARCLCPLCLARRRTLDGKTSGEVSGGGNRDGGSSRNSNSNSNSNRGGNGGGDSDNRDGGGRQST
ncbi:MAG: cysteine-rich CWC family protein [Burkholderiaceae bacterium]